MHNNWYAIANYEQGAGPRAALVLDEQLYDAAALGAEANPLLLGSQHVITQWEQQRAAVDALAQRLRAERAAGRARPLTPGSYKLLVPYQPGRIFGAASNYYEHAAEMGTKLIARSESAPYCFMKAESSVIATEEDVVKPAATHKLDWEVELGVIIGRSCRHVSVEQAHEVIAGYTVFNDISARDLNRRSDYPFTHDWFRGKSFDTFGPMGPWVVPAQCIAEPQKLRMRLVVNDELMQNDTAEGMIFNIAEQIAYLSSMLTLRPGDLIATGTPTGVGMGQGRFLQPGDVMTASIEQIGTLRNRVVAATL
ncbi:fumarylacetoacetate hydrolase family protein [Paucibacter sp. PLA-PC-4]|uniref:fumarylacetoacetate hydrolase family protein n=1 Tax=Paucibacter sp. PLA-PC-4 TaxID=2993655 RepID=UPI00224A4CA1|nr:fumarylacetoacetate hydrolase family protein [Paucibacter sp. PLA-PC-4]MCX2864351.1 fumarylacetoacetate hydrolase family protein [Paucibacter sp. PLA-PC-4]